MGHLSGWWAPVGETMLISINAGTMEASVSAPSTCEDTIPWLGPAFPQAPWPPSRGCPGTGLGALVEQGEAGQRDGVA